MMRIFPSFTILFILLILFQNAYSQALDKNGNPCIENLTNVERDQIKTPEEGKMIFNTTTGCLNYYQNKRWRSFCETTNEKQDQIKFDQNTGKLQYQINGQWYTFSVIGPTEEVAEPEEKLNAKEQETIVEGNSIVKPITPEDCQRKPTRPWAGKDLVSFDQVELEANKPSHGIGYWSITKGDGGHFVDSTNPNSVFTGVQGTTYHLRWTISTLCDTLFDDVLVRIRPPCNPEPSQSFAGSDQFNVEQAFLTANQPKVGTGNWLIVSGIGGRVANPGDPKSAFFGTKGETYVLRWIVRTECGLTQDDVVIKFKPPCRPDPSIADAGPDQLDVEECRMQAVAPQFGKGKWRIVSGKNGRFDDTDTNNSKFFGEPGATYVLQWTVSTQCGSTVDSVTIKFSSYCPDKFIDYRDGTTYSSKRFGKDCWMTENLNYHKEGLEVYCYDGYPEFCREFGGLYTWKAAMQGQTKEESRGVCPEGWHLPSDTEWQFLIDSTGYPFEALLENGKSGFNVLMAGTRYTNGKFFNRNEYAYFWSSSAKEENTAWNRYFPKKNGSPDHFVTSVKHGFSVRCVKDD